MAADWLQNISPSANNTLEKKNQIDPILRDLRAMKDEETKGGVHLSPPPKYNSRGVVNARAPMPNQPKPKFVSHKDPTRGKKGKTKVQSNRLGQVLS